MFGTTGSWNDAGFMFILLDKTELETAQQFLDQASQQNLVSFIVMVCVVV